MYLVEICTKKRRAFRLTLIAEKRVLKAYPVPEAHRPGLSLSGYLKSHAKKEF